MSADGPKIDAKHDPGRFAPAATRIVSTWAAPAFAENLAVDADGKVLVTLHSHDRIDRYDPATDATTVFVELPAPPMGIALDGETVWVTGGSLFKGPGCVMRVASDRSVRTWCDLPHATAMNGCALHPAGGSLLACESVAGQIIAIDTQHPDRFSVWLDDERLRPDVVGYPGANGIKIHDGWAWISVSGRAQMIKVRIRPDGSAGEIETVAMRLIADDFAFGPSGATYIATHPEHSVLRLDPTGSRLTLAGPEQGLAGSTACAFGRAPGDEGAIYVTTNGGLIIPYEGQVQDARLVRIDVGEHAREGRGGSSRS